MTFRDDHEAAVQRADALERELHDEKRERERLEGEVEAMRRAAARAEDEAKAARKDAAAARRERTPQAVESEEPVAGRTTAAIMLGALVIIGVLGALAAETGAEITVMVGLAAVAGVICVYQLVARPRR